MRFRATAHSNARPHCVLASLCCQDALCLVLTDLISIIHDGDLVAIAQKLLGKVETDECVSTALGVGDQNVGSIDLDSKAPALGFGRVPGTSGHTGRGTCSKGLHCVWKVQRVGLLVAVEVLWRAATQETNLK